MPSSPPTLRDMIQAALQRGQTYEQLAAAAVDERTGKRMSRAQINNIGIGRVDRMPYDYHLRALAVALRKPDGDVFVAAIRQWLRAEATISRWLGAEDADAAEAKREETLMDRLDRLDAEARQLREELRRESAGEKAGRRESA